jgi:hypothetical protein
VEALLRGLSRTRVRERFTVEAGDLGAYGLDTPQRTVTTERGAAVHRLSLGKASALGGGRYAASSSEPGQVLVLESLPEHDLAKARLAFRDLRLLDVGPGSIVALEHRGGDRLRRWQRSEAGNWWLFVEGAPTLPVDPRAIDGWRARLATSRATAVHPLPDEGPMPVRSTLIAELADGRRERFQLTTPVGGGSLLRKNDADHYLQVAAWFVEELDPERPWVALRPFDLLPAPPRSWTLHGPSGPRTLHRQQGGRHRLESAGTVVPHELSAAEVDRRLSPLLQLESDGAPRRGRLEPPAARLEVRGDGGAAVLWIQAEPERTRIQLDEPPWIWTLDGDARHLFDGLFSPP